MGLPPHNKKVVGSPTAGRGINMRNITKKLIVEMIQTKKRLIIGTLKISNLDEFAIDIIENDLQRLEGTIIELLESEAENND